MAGRRSRGDSGAVGRRQVLSGLLGSFAATWLFGASGCGPGPQPTAPSTPLVPLQTKPLTGLVAAAGVRWMLVAAPSELFGVKWIPPLVDKAVSGARFDRFAQATGVDLRALPEAVVLASAPSEPGAADDDVMFYLARHAGDAQAIERAFRARLSGSEKRAVERPDLVRVSGKIGRETHAAVFLGSDVAGFQEGGSASRGPARVAALLAEGKLKHAHSAFANEPLKTLAAKLGAAPFQALAPGPFEGDVARGLRGLLRAATAVGASARPGPRETFLVTAAVTGDFTTSAAPASAELLAAWNDLAASRLGHTLGLDTPVTAPVVSAAPDALLLAVELSARSLAEGLAVLTATRVQDIFR